MKKISLIILIALVFSVGFVPDRVFAANATNYIVKLRGSDPSVLSSAGSDVHKQFEFSTAEEFQNIYTFTSQKSLEELKADLGSRAIYVQTNNQFVAADFTTQPLTANDPGFTNNSLNIDKQWAIPATGFDYAWSKTTGSYANIVAVIDTGIDATHEDLQTLRMIAGYDFVNHQNLNGWINSDDNGHGTLVAGILGATANNGRGVVGTNWSVSVMPLKALDSTGRGDTTSVTQAIVWATDHGAAFINLSLGGIGLAHDATLANAISYAFNKGVLIIAAAGNDAAPNGSNLDQEPIYPVCNDNGGNQVLGVSASDQNDLKASFSNYGSSCVDVVAPGKRILSTINHDPLTKAYVPNAYTYASGTSLAAPFVTGEALLIKALYPNASNIQIRDQILSTADPIDNLNLTQCGGNPCRGLLGSGRINVRKAVDKEMVITSIQEGDLITLAPNSQVYQVVSNQRRPVSEFVLHQKFANVPVKVVSAVQFASYNDGAYVTPQDGTLVKTVSSPAVYYMLRGFKWPVLYSIFKQRGFDFASVVTLPDSEVSTWVTGNLLPPGEGTLVRSARDRTLYWVVGETLHPISYNFYIQRGLNVFPAMYVSSQDLAGFPRGDSYIR